MRKIGIQSGLLNLLEHVQFTATIYHGRADLPYFCLFALVLFKPIIYNLYWKTTEQKSITTHVNEGFGHYLPNFHKCKIQGVQEKLCFFTSHWNPSLAYIAVRDIQSSQRNASVQSLLLASYFLYNQYLPSAGEGQVVNFR